MTGHHRNADLARDSDRLRIIIFAVSMIASVALAIALPYLVDVDHFMSSVLLCAPILVMGLWELVTGRNWIQLVAAALVSAAVYFVDWKVSLVALMLFAGAYGVSALSDLFQRLTFLDIVASVEGHGTVPKETVRGRVAAFMFGIPKGMDCRNVKLNRTIRRDRMPWRDILEGMVSALVPMMFLWMFISASTGFRSDVGDNYLLALTISMYVAVFALPVFSLRTLDARIEWAGMSFRIYDGFMGTMRRMLIPALVGLVVLVVAADPGWNALWLIVLSGAFCLALTLISLLAYTMTFEQEFVEDLSESWAESHPVDLYSGFDGRSRGHPLDDGVPGTPRRPVDSCFPPQKN